MNNSVRSLFLSATFVGLGTLLSAAVSQAEEAATSTTANVGAIELSQSQITSPQIKASTQRSPSQFFIRPQQGKEIVRVGGTTGGTSYVEQTFNYDTQTEEPISIRQKHQEYGFGFQHGISDRTALGFELGFRTETIDAASIGSVTNEGPTDMKVNLLFNNQFDRNTLLYGAKFNLSPTTSEGTSFTGSNSVTPFLGLEHFTGSSYIGAKIAFTAELYRGPSSETPDLGVILEGFYEFPVFKDLQMGVAAQVGPNYNGLPKFDKYGMRAYSDWSINEATNLEVVAKATTTPHSNQYGYYRPGTQTATEVGINLRKNL